MRREIERRAGIDAVDIYGLSEVMGPGVASECIESKDGPVIWEDHFYPEIIDPDTGEVLPDGEEGELVFTSLSKEALPIIRYRTRDLTRLLPADLALDAPHRQDHRPLRRHADHPRRQRLPEPDRRTDAARCRRWRRTTSWW
jgi:phenylacetate-coenzyme A ligase PaaK-like adenylate-forming protein